MEFPMQRYQSAEKNTGVIAYEIVPDGISIKFRDINQHVRENYQEKLN
jgi:hypothetical protein